MFFQTRRRASPPLSLSHSLSRRTSRLVLLALLALALHGAAARAVPTGMSPYLYGMHDEPDLSLFPSVDGCAKGWITLLEYIGDSGECSFDLSRLADQGYGIILRLDHGGGPPLPTTPEERAGFAAKFARCVAGSTGVKVWVVGNEPNIGWGHPYTPEEYADTYLAVVDAVNALPNADEHEILFAPMSPWAWTSHWGDWDDGLASAIDRVRGQGRDIDGVAIHAYAREHTPAAITSDAWFPGRENKWRLHFRSYRDTTALLAARGLFDLPLYITEAGTVCDPPCDPYPDVDVGFFVAMYEEIDAWNQQNPHQVIRAVTPYRWTLNDDGSGRDFCIGCSAPLREDMAHAVALGRTWDDTGCHSPISPPPDDDVEPVDGGAGGAEDGGPQAPADGGGDGPTDGADAGASSDEPDSGRGPDEDGSRRLPGSVIDGGCACGASDGEDGAWPLLAWAVLIATGRARVLRQDPAAPRHRSMTRR